jgi:hypothetical protein
LLRVIRTLGVRSNYRRELWTCFGRLLRLARAIGLAIHGDHVIRYTTGYVLPRLRIAVAEAKARLAATLA